MTAYQMLVACHAAWSGWLHRRATFLLEHHLELACLREVMARLLAAPYAVLQKVDFGDAQETIAAAGTTVRLVVTAATQCFTAGAAALTALVMLALWFPPLALVTVVVTALATALGMLFAVAEGKRAARTLDATGRQFAFLHVLLRGAPALRASGATARLLERWQALIHGQERAAVDEEATRVSRGVVLRAGQQLLTLAATLWLSLLTLESKVTLGELMTASLLIGNFTQATGELADIFLSFRASSPRFARVEAMLNASPEAAPRALLESPERQLAEPSASAGLELDGVWFRYDEHLPWVLRNDSRRFPAGAVTRLVAASGSGKTTLLRVLAGLLEPERGSVTVLGCDPSSTSNLVSYQPQQACLLEGSIFTNLRTLSGESLARVLEVAALTGLTELLQTLPMGGDTPISAAGSNLSSGQRQLILLTAAFSSVRPVVLLDEPTSQLDSRSKERIQWRELVQGRTVILVEHAAAQPPTELRSSFGRYLA